MSRSTSIQNLRLLAEKLTDLYQFNFFTFEVEVKAKAEVKNSSYEEVWIYFHAKFHTHSSKVDRVMVVLNFQPPWLRSRLRSKARSDLVKGKSGLTSMHNLKL